MTIRLLILQLLCRFFFFWQSITSPRSASPPYSPDLLPATSGFSQIAVPAIHICISLFYCSIFYVLAVTSPELLPNHIIARIFKMQACANCTCSVSRAPHRAPALSATGIAINTCHPNEMQHRPCAEYRLFTPRSTNTLDYQRKQTSCTAYSF